MQRTNDGIAPETAPESEVRRPCHPTVAALRAKGWSVAAIARNTGASERQAWRWASGESWPVGVYLDALTNLHGTIVDPPITGERTVDEMVDRVASGCGPGRGEYRAVWSLFRPKVLVAVVCGDEAAISAVNTFLAELPKLDVEEISRKRRALMT